MRFRSPKRAAQWKLYEEAKRYWRKLRIETDGYFRCQWAGDGERCKRSAQKDPHHKWGREGKLLHNVRYFMAVCPIHHRLIHSSPRAAYALGYLILRSLRKIDVADENKG